ncbi:phosphoribosylpyrophosphate synthetase, putative [Eimeria mitis]|uniref:ribose-phosphate diphosphokinase n=1 Tax=Eimeria mitis TaxID=44415 RepID=U6K6N9_9EIME|nr:phosphoribosylpyrophosphate synthetase, putative [Eimeria mitis]CDJ31148.1 phosphoribosylpyrophosphate synthetase, putative [Eimeria mitis]
MVGFARLVRACRLPAAPVLSSILKLNRLRGRIPATSSRAGQAMGQQLGGERFTDRTYTYSVPTALACAAAGLALFTAVSASRTEGLVLCEGPGCDKNHENPLWRSRESQPFTRKLGDALLFTGTANEHLGSAVAERLSTRLGRVSVGRFADGEVNIQFLDSLRGKDVYIIQPTSTPVNDHLMELLLMISTCRRASAKKITAVIPYFGYARQDRKMNSRVPISAADVARMMEAMGVDRVVAVDLHCGQIQGFFGPRVPVDNVEAQIVGLDYFEAKELDKPVVVSPDAGGVYRARKFQEGMVRRGYKDCSIAMLIKRRIKANEVESMDLVGSVEGRDAIIVDDMIDTAGTADGDELQKDKDSLNIYIVGGRYSSDPSKRKLE